MRTLYMLIFAAALALAACSDDDKNDNNVPTPDSGKAPGTEGGPCYGNKTCNAPLVCLSNLCVRLHDAGGGKEDGPGAKKDGPGPKNDGPVTKTDGPVTKSDGPVTDKGKVPDSSPPPCTSGCVTTVAGVGKAGLLDGPALQAQFKAPTGLALSSTGVLYIADRHNHQIRKLDKGKVTTLAGTGTQGYKDGAVSTAQFNEPYDLVVAGNGTIYVVERGSHRVRAISTGIVTTVAGTGSNGFADGGPGVAKFNYPTGIALTGSGALLVADKSNNRIRSITGSQVSTHAGAGSAGLTNGAAATALFKSPYDVAISQGVVYVADASNNVIRAIASGMVSTLAGDGTAGFQDGAAASARFSGPGSVAADAAGKVYVSDYGNHRVRVIANKMVVTLAGSGIKGYQDGQLTLAMFNNPAGIVVDAQGRVYVADGGNHRIRKIVP